MKDRAALWLAFALLFTLVACGGKPAGKDIAGGPAEAQPADSEIVLIDDERFTVSVTYIRSDDQGGLHLGIRSVSRSADTNYSCIVKRTSVNGVAVNGSFIWGIDVGDDWASEIYFLSSDLYGNDIGGYTDIALPFSIYISDSGEHVLDETFHIYPDGEDKAVRYVREPQPTDVVLVDNESVTVTLTGVEPDDPEDYILDLFYENKTARNVYFDTNRYYVNGVLFYRSEEPGYLEAGPGTCGFSRIALPKSLLQENGISDVSTFQTTFFAYNDDVDYGSPGSELAKQDVTICP